MDKLAIQTYFRLRALAGELRSLLDEPQTPSSVYVTQGERGRGSSTLRRNDRANTK